MTSVPTHPVDVILILTAADHVLLALREGTGYADGMWNLPSGKLETGEDVVSAIIREAREEIGVTIDPDEPQMVTTVHHRNAVGLARIGLVFTVEHNTLRHGEAANTEPHKCAKIEWFPVDMLPSNTYVYTAAAIAGCRDGTRLRLTGWR